MMALTPRLLHSKGGFSLIEVLIAVVIVGVMSLGIASIMTYANNANRNITMTLEATSTTAMIGTLLSDRAFCDENFTVNNIIDIPLDNNLKDLIIPIKKLAYPAGTGSTPPEIIFDSVNPSSSGGIKIKNITLSNFKSLGTSQQMARLNITYDKGTVHGPPLTARNIYLRLETATTTAPIVRVLHCNSIGFGPVLDSATATGPTPPDQQEIPDNLYTNLVAGTRALTFDGQKNEFITTTITNWQKLGLITSTGRYMTIAKFSGLIKDGQIGNAVFGSNICELFSGKVIDVENVPLINNVLNWSSEKADCTNLLNK